MNSNRPTTQAHASRKANQLQTSPQTGDQISLQTISQSRAQTNNQTHAFGCHSLSFKPVLSAAYKNLNHSGPTAPSIRRSAAGLRPSAPAPAPSPATTPTQLQTIARPAPTNRKPTLRNRAKLGTMVNGACGSPVPRNLPEPSSISILNMRKSLFLLCVAGLLSAAFASPSKIKLPAWFEPAGNGQYLSHGGDATLVLSPAKAELVAGANVLSVTLGGAAASPLAGRTQLPGKSQYRIGNNRDNWRLNVPQFNRVRQDNAYPGIDVEYYFSGSQLEFDFLVAPGANPSAIRLNMAKSGPANLQPAGDLRFANGMALRKPLAYQETANGRRIVAASYALDANGEARIALGVYDRQLPLVIDPIVQASYVGGDGNERINAMKVDADGSVWITGSTGTLVFPPSNKLPISVVPNGQKDIFLARLTPGPDGTLGISYWNQLGGPLNEEATAFAFDSRGFVYLTGWMDAGEFPLAGRPLIASGTENAFGSTDTFIIRIRPEDDGTDALYFSQLYGGTGLDVANAIAVDNVGNVYIGGYTNSDKLPSVNDTRLQCCLRGGYEGLLLKATLDNPAASLAYVTYFGGSSSDVVTALALDAAGDLLAAGYTSSENFPATSDAFTPQPRANFDGFLAKLDLNRPRLDALLYATTFGGSGLDIPRAIAVDGTNVWIAGDTLSRDFPVTANAHRSVLAGSSDAFLLKFDMIARNGPDAIPYSTYLGGSDGESLYGMALMPNNRFALTGYTYSWDFPRLEGAIPTRPTGRGAEAFVTVLDTTRPGAAALVLSNVFGGALGDTATGVGIAPNGDILASGFSFSRDLPVTDASKKVAPGGSVQGFLLRLAAPR